MIPSLLNRLPHTRRIRRHERKKFVDGCSPRGRDRFRRKKRGLDAAARRCCAMVGEGRDKRVLGRTVNRRERKGKGRSVSNCERVSSRARLSSVENGEAVLALEVCTPWVRVEGEGEGDPEEVYEERAENAAQRGFLNLWHAGLARLAARLRSIRIHPAIVFESGGSCWDDALPRNHPFDVIRLYTPYYVSWFNGTTMSSCLIFLSTLGFG